MERIRQSEKGPDFYPLSPPVGEEQKKICGRIREMLGDLTEYLEVLQSYHEEMAHELMDARRKMARICKGAAMTTKCWEAEYLVIARRDDINWTDEHIRLFRQKIDWMKNQMEDFGCEKDEIPSTLSAIQ